MSGRKQHYIPQVLLKGFSPSPDAKSPPIFVYSRERGCYPTNTKDAAAEREFYSPIIPEQKTLDDSITDYENELARQLTEIKSLGFAQIKPELPSTVIAHLAIRNDHTRKTFANAGGLMIGALGKTFSDPSTVQPMLGIDQSYSKSRLKQEIRKLVAEKFPGLDRNKRAQLELKLAAQFAQNFDGIFEQQSPLIQGAVTKVQESLSDIAKNSHVKALKNDLAPEKRIAALSKLRWATIAGDFVLPDCVAIAIQADSSVRPYILTNADELHSVFMPITKQLGLLGKRSEEEIILGGAINEMAASCSTDFFVYPERKHVIESLIPYIGTRTSELVTSLTEEAVKSSKLAMNKSD